MFVSDAVSGVSVDIKSGNPICYQSIMVANKWRSLKS